MPPARPTTRPGRWTFGPTTGGASISPSRRRRRCPRPRRSNPDAAPPQRAFHACVLPGHTHFACASRSPDRCGPVQFLDETLASAAANLALDEALLLQAEAGAGCEVLRVWEWPAPAVVLGSGCRLADDVDEAACAADTVPLLRRSSGGGTVLLGPGCLLYSLVLAYERSPLLAEVGSSYQFILDRVGQALGGPATGIRQAGISDLAVGDRKFSGNAQQRKRNHLLHHGTILHAFDLPLIGRYLRPPPRQP